MKILLATDGSAHSQAAIDLLNRISYLPGSELTLLSVLELPSVSVMREVQRDVFLKLEQLIRQETEETLIQQTEYLEKVGWTVSMKINEGHAAEQIVSTAEALETDLVVIGSHGRGAVGRFLLGSVSNRVVHHAPCSVWIVRWPVSDGYNSVSSPLHSFPRLFKHLH